MSGDSILTKDSAIKERKKFVVYLYKIFANEMADCVCLFYRIYGGCCSNELQAEGLCLCSKAG